MILELDDAVGVILKTLRENKLEDNTIIVFTSDVRFFSSDAGSVNIYSKLEWRVPMFGGQ